VDGVREPGKFDLRVLLCAFERNVFDLALAGQRIDAGVKLQFPRTFAAPSDVPAH
jgi:hypothetical protein